MFNFIFTAKKNVMFEQFKVKNPAILEDICGKFVSVNQLYRLRRGDLIPTLSDVFVMVVIDEHSSPEFGWGQIKNYDIGVLSKNSYSEHIHFSNREGSWNAGVDEIALLGRYALCTKSFPGVKRGEIIDMGEMESQLGDIQRKFDPKYFNFLKVKPMETLSLTLHGYAVNFDIANKTVNWGCRTFTFDEINTVYNTLSLLNRKDLSFGLGYGGDFSPVSYDAFSEMVAFINKFNK